MPNVAKNNYFFILLFVVFKFVFFRYKSDYTNFIKKYVMVYIITFSNIVRSLSPLKITSRAPP